MSICGAMATVRIERIYYQLGGIATIPNNGIQRASCETIISFTDQSPPFISVSTDIDTLIACDTTGLSKLLSARSIDNCDDDIPVSISVVLDETDPCFSDKGSRDTTKAIVTFTAIDDCGNVGKTTREITIIRPNEIEHIVKTTNMTLECTDTILLGGMPGLKIGTLKNGQFTVKDTIQLSTEKYICGYILTKKDLEIPSTICGRKMYRYWSIVDWCTPETGPLAIDTQLIKYTDTKAPVFAQGEGTTKILEVGAFECTYDITKLAAPKATDNCSMPIVRLDNIFRIENGQHWLVPISLYTKLDVDSFYLRWIAEDICHEQLLNDTLMQLVIIKDVTRPTAVCTDQINISVGSNISIIDTADVDAGSYDACGILKKEISRDGINFGPTVTFTCDDVKDTVKVYFRVTDIHGNTNSCWLNVHPEDKILPICTSFSPGTSSANGNLVGNTANVTINCNESKVAAIQDKNNPTAAVLAAIGGPLPDPRDNCQAINKELKPLVLRVGICGQNIYQRRWVAIDTWGLQSVDTCTQIISINLVEDWKITFPDDVNMTCPVVNTAADSVILKNGTCDKLAVSVETQMFDVVPDACFKIVKTYHIINWCNYKAGNKPTHAFNNTNLPANKMPDTQIPSPT